MILFIDNKIGPTIKASPIANVLPEGTDDIPIALSKHQKCKPLLFC